jgi:hypothetical protein
MPMKANKVFAVFDISSSSVAGAHVLTKNEAVTKAVFLASSRRDASFHEDMDIGRFVEETVINLETVIGTIQKSDVHHPPYIQVVLASPWYRSQTRSIVYKKTTSFTCTKKLVDDLIAKELDYIVTKEEGPFGSFGKESIIIERQISQIKLNGYITNNPYGKKIEHLEIFLTITMSPKPILDRFADTLRRFYGTRKIGYTTSPFTAFIVIRDTMPEIKECVVIDVGEEVTDVAFIKDELFSYQHSFPVGTYALYRKVSENSANSMQEAKSILESHRLGKLENSQKAKVEKAITEFIKEWQSSLQQILDNGHYGFCMPSNCFVMSDPRFENIFIETVKNDPFIQHTCGKGVADAFFMATDVIKDQIKTADNSPVDTPLATASLFVDRIL